MISFVREKFVENTVRIVKNVREETVVPVSSQLRRRGIVGGVQTKPDSTLYRCFETLLIGRTDGTELLLSYFIKVRFNHLMHFPTPVLADVSSDLLS